MNKHPLIIAIVALLLSSCSNSIEKDKAFLIIDASETYISNLDSLVIEMVYSHKDNGLINKNVSTNSSVNTTMELVKVINEAVGNKYFSLNHPERKIFQAIRIEVNNELGVLEKVLPDAINMLNKGGRICVITFHSLEDRIVKQIFKKYSDVDEMVKGLPEIPEEYKPLIKLINKKPILPSEKEITENTRSKSAKLRIIERI